MKNDHFYEVDQDEIEDSEQAREIENIPVDLLIARQNKPSFSRHVRHMKKSRKHKGKK